MVKLLIQALSPVITSFLEDEAKKIPNVDQTLVDNVIEAILALAESLA